jgi:hypothetical protein
MQQKKKEIYMNIISWINIYQRYIVWGCTAVNKYYISESVIKIKKKNQQKNKYENIFFLWKSNSKLYWS